MDFILEIFFSLCAIVILLFLVSQIRIISDNVKKMKSLQQIKLDDESAVLQLEGNEFSKVGESKEGEE